MPSQQPPAWRGRPLLHALLAVLAAIGLGVWIGPRPLSLAPQAVGDAALLARTRIAIAASGEPDAGTDGYRSLSVVEVDGDQVSYAGIGNRGDGQPPAPTTAYELASITKTFTALMLADAVARGEVRLDDRLATYLPELRSSPSGDVTLEELATHRSGLPSYGDPISGATYEGFGNSDVEQLTPETLIEQTRGLSLDGRGTHQYSNLGVSLLGYALARATHSVTWNALVESRVLGPAGMTSTIFASHPDQIPVGSAIGVNAGGAPLPYSVGPAYQPAGTATLTTTHDLGAYGRWLLSGSAIGTASMIPRYGIDETDLIGLVWMVTTVNGTDIAWHNGGVPGFSSVLVVDPTHRRMIAVLGNSEKPVDDVAFRLLDPAADLPEADPWPERALAALCLALVVGCVVAVRLFRTWWALTAAGLVAQASLVLLLRFGPWHELPIWVWSLATALVFWGTLEAADRLRGRTGRRSVRLVVGLAAAAAFYLLALWLSV